MAIKIDRIDAGSEAEALGLQPGDELLSVDENELNDTLDYDFYTDSSSFHLEAKVADIRIINRAKLLLVQHLQMTETEAHKYIEKQAMDRCVTKRAVAEQILSTYK